MANRVRMPVAGHPPHTANHSSFHHYLLDPRRSCKIVHNVATKLEDGVIALCNRLIDHPLKFLLRSQVPDILALRVKATLHDRLHWRGLQGLG
jgi:hypothetical protein